MSRSFGHCIADSLELCLGYSERLMKDVTAATFARYASPGGQLIESNHPAFVFGHLCLYGPRILTQLNQPSPAIPAGFESIFSKDAKCVDDPNGTIYPGLEAVMSFYYDGYRAASTALRNVADEVLQQANPMEGRMATLFPSLGSLQAFYCGGHMMMHLGQISAWRRMMGLGAA